VHDEMTQMFAADERGVFALNFQQDKIAYLSRTQGEIVLLDLPTQREIRRIDAHKHALQTISRNFGQFVVTTSEEGTIVRVWEAGNGALQREFRRGTSSAEIDCLVQSEDGAFAIAHSNHGSIHVFNLDNTLANRTGAVASWMNSVTSLFGKDIVVEYACCIIDGVCKDERVEMLFDPSSDPNTPHRLIVIGLDGETVDIRLRVENTQMTVVTQTAKAIRFNPKEVTY